MMYKISAIVLFCLLLSSCVDGNNPKIVISASENIATDYQFYPYCVVIAHVPQSVYLNTSDEVHTYREHIQSLMSELDKIEAKMLELEQRRQSNR